MIPQKIRICSWMVFCCLTTTAQTAVQTDKPRSLLQEEFIIRRFIQPQLEKGGGLSIRSAAMMDSLFHEMETGWRAAAPDSLKKHPQDIPLADFKNLDAYCYFWALLSIRQDMDLSRDYTRHLVNGYMIPALKRDYALLRRRPTLTALQFIHGGTLGNTLALGSQNGMDTGTVLACYRLYNNFNDLLRTFSHNADTAIRQYAVQQLHELERFRYDLPAKHALYTGEPDKAELFVLTGLSTDGYPKDRAVWICGQLLTIFAREGAKDKAFTLLNTLLVNTTADNLRRDTLLAWYRRVDTADGRKMYDNVTAKLSVSAFKNTGKQIRLPASWNFIVNAVPQEKVGKVKYFLVDVWESSCAPCLAEIPGFNSFYDQYSRRDDILFVSINTDYINGKMDEKYVMDRSKDLKIRFPVVYDNAAYSLNNQLSVQGYPSKFILDSSGNIIAKTDGSSLSLGSFELFIKELK